MDGVELTLRTADGRELHPPARTGRALGRLAPPAGSAPPERHVRCACEDCGAHLLATRADDHAGVSGVCLVCGSLSIRPL